MKPSGGWDYEIYFGTVDLMYTLVQVATLEGRVDGVARHVVSR